MTFVFACAFHSCMSGDYFTASWSSDDGDHCIITQGDTFQQLIDNVKGAVNCHLHDEPRAARVQIIFMLTHTEEN